MPAGRPSAYKPEFAETVRELCEGGATDAEMAAHLGIDISNFYRWKNRHPEFREALKDWKEYADSRVEASLYKKAHGFYVEQEKVVTSGGKVFVQKYTEYYPPDTTAIIYWTKNRNPDQWRDRREVESTVKGEMSSDPLGQLATSIAALADKLAEDGEE